MTLQAQNSAIMEFESTNQGILIPRMSETQRLAIQSPANSLMVFDTTSQLFFYYDRTNWKSIENGINGTDGANGADGANGLNGTNGTDGRGIVRVEDNLDGTFTYVYSDSIRFTTRDLTGPQGEKGLQGVPGDPASADNMGNHTATSNINLAGNFLSGDGDSEGLYISSDGKVGLGEVNPSGQFVIRSDIENLTENVIVLKNRYGTASGTGSRLVFQGYRDTNMDHEVASIEAHHQEGDLVNLVHGAALVFKTNTGDAPYNTQGLERMRITEDGNIGIAIASPQSKLHVNGHIQMVDGNQGIGNVMVSDINGKASWSPLESVPNSRVDSLESELDSLKALVSLMIDELNLFINVQEKLNKGVTPKQIIDSGISIDSLYGKIYQGGLIFYYDTVNESGLVAEVSSGDASAVWTNNDYSKTSAFGEAIGTGQSNTTAIINTLGSINAPGRCNDLDLNGYTDWFMPSINELLEMYYKIGPGATGINQNIGNFGQAYYWSSTESTVLDRDGDAAYALSVNFRDNEFSGSKTYTKDNSGCTVRAVRAF